jgi:hypothetical protein
LVRGKSVKLFFRSVLIYFALSLALVVLTRGASAEVVDRAVVSSLGFAVVLWRFSLWLLGALVLVAAVVGPRTLRDRLPDIGYAALGCVLLQTAFSFTKSLIPDIVPFYADAPLAWADSWLHGGADPWVWAHAVAPVGVIDLSGIVYLFVWSLAALTFPIFLALTDPDAQRVRRFSLLFLGAWILIGNVLAIAVSSAGPVFFDALIGGDRFAGLTAALQSSGLADSVIGRTQNYLWAGYSSGGLALGSGISAFPSMHLAVATVVGLYLYERSVWLAPVGAGFVGSILFLSVFTGYHYAIDGYFSILAVAAAWAMSRRQGT